MQRKFVFQKFFSVCSRGSGHTFWSPKMYRWAAPFKSLTFLRHPRLLENKTSPMPHSPLTRQPQSKTTTQSARNHAKARAGALVDHHRALEGHPHSAPVPGTPGRLWVAQQHYPHKNSNNTGCGAAVLVAVEQDRSASVCNSVACDASKATSENKTTFETHCEANEISPVHQCRMLTIAVCTPADRAERASMVSVRTVVVVILDSGRRTSTAIRFVKTLTIVVLLVVRAMETRQWRRDASGNMMRAISVEKLVFDRLRR